MGQSVGDTITNSRGPVQLILCMAAPLQHERYVGFYHEFFR